MDTDDRRDRNEWAQANLRPVPDPTVLTSQLVDAAKDDLRRERELIRDGLRYRTEAIDRDLSNLHRVIDNVLAQMDEKVRDLRELGRERFLRVDERFNVMLEHFAAVDALFHERDVRHQQAAQAGERALHAAFEAARVFSEQQNAAFQQSTAKSEAAVMKQMDQLMTLLQTSIVGLDSKIGDLKERLTLQEGRNAGIGMSWGILVGAAGIIIAGLALFLGLYKR